MSDIPITISIEAPNLDRLVEQFRSLDTELSKKGVEFEKVGRSVQTFGKRLYADGELAVKKFTPEVTGITDKARAFAKEIDALVGTNRSLTEILEREQLTMKEVKQQTGFTVAQWERFRRIAEKTKLSVGTVAEMFRKTEGAIGEVSLANRLLVSRLGATGIALTRLGRSLFWAGLGTMFFFMSLSRLNRMMFSIEVAQYGVYRATRSLEKAQKRYLEMLREYGPAAEETIEASESVKDAQMALRIAHMRVREATESHIFAWGMLIFGTIPTLLRAVSDVTVSLWGLSIAEIFATKATIKLALAKLFLRYGIFAIIAGLAVLTAWLYMSSKAASVATESMEKFENRLGPHSVMGMLKETQEEIGVLEKQLSRLEAPEIGRIRATRETNIVTINVINPQVRSRRDIVELRRELEKTFIRYYRARGGRIK